MCITQLEKNGPLWPLGPLADPPDFQTGTLPCMAGCQTWIFCRKTHGYMANKTWGTWGTWGFFDWWIPVSNLSDKPTYLRTGACVLRRVAGWVAGGCWDDSYLWWNGSLVTCDDWDHSWKFPAVSTSKNILGEKHVIVEFTSSWDANFQMGRKSKVRSCSHIILRWWVFTSFFEVLTEHSYS